MADLFDVPGGASESSDFFALKDNVGNLVLFTPTEYVESMTTVNGEKDAVRTSVVVFDDSGSATEYDDALIFAGAVIARLKPYAKRGTGKVLARVSRGTAKKGQNPPYVLEVPTGADKKLATDYLTKATDPFAL